MDTLKDFLFLNANVATDFNPFCEGEYLVIQTYPHDKKLVVKHRSFDYQEANSSCQFENLAHDYTSFSLRIFHDSRLWTVDSEGNPGSRSLQQDWKIAQEYKDADSDGNFESEIDICNCGYPYFSVLIDIDIYYWKSITCLVEDRGREIINCPNCNALIEDQGEDEDDFDEEESRPAACIGCENYHGQYYGGNMLVCAIHPHGVEGENCPDYCDRIL
ncbi:hypothetical protein [Nostoc sp. MG11]|uniref:hypothetical protein n=1 Tax=Nostoc sp. MG11 TaxID=2721166 RepID=UPI001867009F|nr:hypothetical protein [Nostoc sp. MG11]